MSVPQNWLSVLLQTETFNLETHENISALLNILLVLTNARPAYLMESSNFVDPADYAKIKNWLTTNGKTLGLSVAEQSSTQIPRLLIYKPHVIGVDLVNKIIRDDDDQAVGKALGFSCPGEYTGDITYAASYEAIVPTLLQGQPINIMAEGCPRAFAKEMETKRASFQQSLNKFFPKSIVKSTLTTTYSTPVLFEKIRKSSVPISDTTRQNLINKFREFGWHKSAKLVSQRKDKRYRLVWTALVAFLKNDPTQPLYGTAALQNELARVEEHTKQFEKDVYKFLTKK